MTQTLTLAIRNGSLTGQLMAAYVTHFNETTLLSGFPHCQKCNKYKETQKQTCLLEVCFV